MTHRLTVSPPQSGATGVQEILRRQVDAAQSQLPHARTDQEGIHQVRRQLKAARASLRLLRPAIGERAYRAENTPLRDAGRLLRAARDSVVLVNTLEAVEEEIGDEELRQALKGLERQLQEDARRAGLKVRRSGLQRVRGQLAPAQARTLSAPRAEGGWKPVRRGLIECYRKARKMARDSRRDAGCESLHEWRKRTKSLHSQLMLLAPLQNASLTRMADRLHRVSNRLGEERDLAELSRLLRRRRRLVGEKARTLLDRCIARRRRKLRKKAVTAGERAYRERPGHFAARLRRYMRQWPR